MLESHCIGKLSLLLCIVGQVEYCRLANLPDLDQDNSFVRRTLLDWVGSLKGSYDFDGLRIGKQ